MASPFAPQAEVNWRVLQAMQTLSPLAPDATVAGLHDALAGTLAASLSDDGEAQVAVSKLLRGLALMQARPPVDCLAAAEIFARKAAIAGLASGAMELAMVLLGLAARDLALGDCDSVAAREAEALHWISFAADAGDEIAENNLTAIAEQLSPEVVALAQQFERTA